MAKTVCSTLNTSQPEGFFFLSLIHLIMSGDIIHYYNCILGSLLLASLGRDQDAAKVIKLWAQLLMGNTIFSSLRTKAKRNGPYISWHCGCCGHFQKYSSQNKFSKTVSCNGCQCKLKT